MRVICCPIPGPKPCKRCKYKTTQRHRTPVRLSTQHTTLPRFFMDYPHNPEPQSKKYRQVKVSRPVCFVQGQLGLVGFGCGGSRLVPANKSGFGDVVRMIEAQG